MTQIDCTGRDRLLVEVDGERQEVFNHVTVETSHYVNSVNGYETFEPDVYSGDSPGGSQPDAVTARVATLLQDEFDVDVESLGIDVIDPDDEEVTVL